MEQATRSADQVLTILKANPERMQALQANPGQELQKLVDEAKAVTPPWVGDIWLYRTAVFVLGVLALTAAVGSIALVFGDRTTPEVLVALGSAAIGALVGLFAPSPTGK
jgi:hypothetical protein